MGLHLDINITNTHTHTYVVSRYINKYPFSDMNEVVLLRNEQRFWINTTKHFTIIFC